MLHRVLTSSVTIASLVIALGSTASAGISGLTPSQGQHTWVGASIAALAVSSVYPGYGFSASERPAFDAGGAGSTTPAAGSTSALVGQSLVPGAIALSARRHDGAEAIDVTGTAPPGASVEITARARLSIDLPVVFLNRIDTVADASGAFSVILPIAPDYVQGSEIFIKAEAPGATSTTVSYVFGAPSSGPPISSIDTDGPDL